MYSYVNSLYKAARGGKCHCWNIISCFDQGKIERLGCIICAFFLHRLGILMHAPALAILLDCHLSVALRAPDGLENEQ